MNWVVLKDLKTMLGFLAAFLLGLVGLMLAVNNNNYWVVFFVLNVIFTVISVIRADKIYQQRLSSDS